MVTRIEANEMAIEEQGHWKSKEIASTSVADTPPQLPQIEKPKLIPPRNHLFSLPPAPIKPLKSDIYSLYLELDKMLVDVDNQLLAQTKVEIEENMHKSAAIQKEKVEEMKKAQAAETSVERWSVSTKVFHWMLTCVGLVTGAILIASGVGVVAGTLMFTAALLTLTSQILEVTGGWKKILKLLPGDDEERKKALITWIQMGIAVLAIAMSIAGGIFTSFSAIKETMSMANIFMGSFALAGDGISTIGMGLSESAYKNRVAAVREKIMKARRTTERGNDLMEFSQEVMDAQGLHFEHIADIFKTQKELVDALQAGWRR